MSRAKFYYGISNAAWEYISVHLHDTSKSHPGHVTHAYCSEAMHLSALLIIQLLTPKHTRHRFSNSRVEEDDPLNLSLIINSSCLTIHAICSQQQALMITSPMLRINNRNLTGTNYQKRISTINIQPTWTHSYHLSISLTPTSSQNNRMLSTATQRLLPTSCKVQPLQTFLPKPSTCKHLKPGWTPELSAAHNKSKRAYRTWIRAGRFFFGPEKQIYMPEYGLTLTIIMYMQGANCIATSNLHQCKLLRPLAVSCTVSLNATMQY